MAERRRSRRQQQAADLSRRVVGELRRGAATVSRAFEKRGVGVLLPWKVPPPLLALMATFYLAYCLLLTGAARQWSGVTHAGMALAWSVAVLAIRHCNYHRALLLAPLVTGLLLAAVTFVLQLLHRELYAAGWCFLTLRMLSLQLHRTDLGWSPRRGRALLTALLLLLASFLALLHVCVVAHHTLLLYERHTLLAPPATTADADADTLRASLLVHVSARVQHSMYIECLHVDRSDSGPVVVLDSGLPYTSAAFEQLFAMLMPPHRSPLLQAHSVRALCRYDRSGYGRSQRGAYPRHVRRLADELHELLLAARLAPPYLLVGWSFGGSVAQQFACSYSSDVQGLTLVESNSGHELSNTPGFAEQLNEGITAFNLARFLNGFGITRLAQALEQWPDEAGGPPRRVHSDSDSDEAMRAAAQRAHEVTAVFTCGAQFAETAYRELLAFKESEEQLHECHSSGRLKRIPIVALISERGTHTEIANQRRMAQQSAVHEVLFTSSDHYVPYRNASAILTAIDRCLTLSEPS